MNNNINNNLNNNNQEISRLKEERLSKLKKLEENLLIDPFLLNLQDSQDSCNFESWKDFKQNRKLSDKFQEEFKNLENGIADEKAEIWVAGRIHSSRNTGMFLDIYDENGKIQIVTERENLSSDYQVEIQDNNINFLDLLDKGDIIAVLGNPYRTPRGELSLKTKKMFFVSQDLYT